MLLNQRNSFLFITGKVSSVPISREECIFYTQKTKGHTGFWWSASLWCREKVLNILELSKGPLKSKINPKLFGTRRPNSQGNLGCVHASGARTLVPRHRYKMALCSDTGYPICWYVHNQQTEHLSTAFKVCEPHHACIPCSIYLLDYCFVCCHCVCWHFRVVVGIYKGVNFILTPFCSVRHHFDVSIPRGRGYTKQWFVGKVEGN